MSRKTNDTEMAAPVAPQVVTDNREQSDTKAIKYVVLRDGYRVSANEYNKPKDPKAISELKFWSSVEKNHSWGAPVKIVQYDNKLHRVWGAKPIDDNVVETINN